MEEMEKKGFSAPILRIYNIYSIQQIKVFG
jgi:hypothetical protein